MRLSNFRQSLLILGVLSLMVSCGGKSPSQNALSANEAFTPNMAVFYQPMPVVWNEVVNTVQNTFLYRIEVVNRQGWFFSTEQIREYDELPRRRFRISGSLKFDGEGVVVVLYKQEEVHTRQGWQELESNFSTERAILQKVGQKMQSYK